ncbi:Pentatricopeptide repeat-containing protein At4g02750 [Linum perenne]
MLLNYLRRLVQAVPRKLDTSSCYLSIRTLSTQCQLSSALPYLKPLNSKLSSFMKSGLVEDAENLFDEMPSRNVVTWNTMINGYFKNGKPDKAFGLLGLMPKPDIYTYNTVISGLVQCGDVLGARKVFDGMEDRDSVTWNSIIAGYVHGGMVGEAMELFGEMDVEMRNVVTWNLIIGGLVNDQRVDLAMECFQQMRVKDAVSWIVMVSGLAKEGRLVEARELYDEQMPVKDAHACNSLIAGYIRAGEFDMAERLFHAAEIKDSDSWKLLINGLITCGRFNDVVRLYVEAPEKCHTTWNALLQGLVENGSARTAHVLLEKLPYGDIVSWTNVIVGYFRSGEVGCAVKVFHSMPSLDVTLWNVMICGLGENGHGEEGIRLFLRMKQLGVSPDKSTFTSVLTICSNLPALYLGKQVCGHVIKTGFSQTIEALEMFEEMRSSNVKPNRLTFIGVMTACSHAGLVEQGRFGLIEEATSFIDEMREVPVSVWGALLGACRVHRNFEVGVIAAENVLAMEPDRSGTYLILAEMYASIGRRNDAERVLDRMKNSGVKKQPGCSWIEMNDCGHVFLSGDKSHLEFCRMNQLLEILHMDVDAATNASSLDRIEA